MKLEIGPTGKLVRGSVFDVNKAALERALRQYDNLLYITWNPKKRSGMGCWEIRRRPEKKTAVHQGSWNGIEFYALESKELDLVNHVLDLPVLTYKAVQKIQEMDAWKVKDFAHELDRKAAEHADSVREKTADETRYLIKQHKREIQEFKELLLSGMNPARVLKHWGRS
jgi:hypothetical protein